MKSNNVLFERSKLNFHNKNSEARVKSNFNNYSRYDNVESLNKQVNGSFQQNMTIHKEDEQLLYDDFKSTKQISKLSKTQQNQMFVKIDQNEKIFKVVEGIHNSKHKTQYPKNQKRVFGSARIRVN